MTSNVSDEVEPNPSSQLLETLLTLTPPVLLLPPSRRTSKMLSSLQEEMQSFNWLSPTLLEENL